MTVLQSKLQCFPIMRNYLLHNFFWKTRKHWVGPTRLSGRKGGIALGDKKNYATPTNEDFGQTSNWSKLVAAYLPVARLNYDLRSSCLATPCSKNYLKL